MRFRHRALFAWAGTFAKLQDTGTLIRIAKRSIALMANTKNTFDTYSGNRFDAAFVQTCLFWQNSVAEWIRLRSCVQRMRSLPTASQNVLASTQCRTTTTRNRTGTSGLTSQKSRKNADAKAGTL